MAKESNDAKVAELDDLEERLKALDKAEKAIDDAYNTGKAERAKITKMAQLDAAEAVAMAGMAMEADVEADEAMRLTVIAEQSGDRERAKTARKKEREARKKAKEEHNAATRSAKQAYDAIKFSAPNKMGFMRVVQVVFAVHIGMALVWLMLTSRDTMATTFQLFSGSESGSGMSTGMDWVMVILEGVAFWMFINRYKVGRPLVIGMAIFGLIVPAAFDVITGRFNPFNLIFNGAFYIFLLFYFIFSSRVKATLVNDISMRKGDYEKDDFVINRHGWPFVRNLIIYFIVFSIVGHWMEMGMCQFIIMGLVQGDYDPSNTMLWRDWLYPFPMEGAAVVVIALVLYPFYLWLKKKFASKVWVAYIISFFAGALLCTIIEFSMGLFVNDHYQLWDYRENFGNIMGQVCLQNTTAFGVVAAIITWWVYPMLERWIARIPRDIMNIAFVVIAVFGAIIWSLYLINPAGTDDKNLPEYKDHPEEVELLYQQRLIGTDLSDINSTIDMLERDIDKSNRVDKEKLKAQAEELRKDVKAMLEDGLGLEEFPSLYDQFLAKLETSRSDQQANAQDSPQSDSEGSASAADNSEGSAQSSAADSSKGSAGASSAGSSKSS